MVLAQATQGLFSQSPRQFNRHAAIGADLPGHGNQIHFQSPVFEMLFCFHHLVNRHEEKKAFFLREMGLFIIHLNLNEILGYEIAAKRKIGQPQSGHR